MNSANYNGNLQHYPFAYQKFRVTRVHQTIDGEEYLYRSLELVGNTKVENLVGYDRFLTAYDAARGLGTRQKLHPVHVQQCPRKCR